MRTRVWEIASQFSNEKIFIFTFNLVMIFNVVVSFTFVDVVLIMQLISFFEKSIFENLKDFIKFVNTHADSQNYAIVITRFKISKKVSNARSFCDAIVKKNLLIRWVENVDIQTHDWFNVHLALSRSWILILICEVWLFVILITIMILLFLQLILLCESLLSSTKQWNSTLLVNSRFRYRSQRFFQRCVWITKNLSSRHEICIISRRK